VLQTAGVEFEGNVTITYSERELFESFASIVQVLYTFRICFSYKNIKNILFKEMSPDILVGYEVQRSSWGYLCRRAATLNINYAVNLSRMPSSTFESRFSGPNG
jgi:DNA polymerase elongation subunit (family B)